MTHKALTEQEAIDFVHERVDVWNDGSNEDIEELQGRLQSNALTLEDIQYLTKRFKDEAARLISEACQEYGQDSDSLLKEVNKYQAYWGGAINVLEKGLVK